MKKVYCIMAIAAFIIFSGIGIATAVNGGTELRSVPSHIIGRYSVLTYSDTRGDSWEKVTAEPTITINADSVIQPSGKIFVIDKIVRGVDEDGVYFYIFRFSNSKSMVAITDKNKNDHYLFQCFSTVRLSEICRYILLKQ